MKNSYTLLKDEFQKLSRIAHAITFLQWDQLVMMPPGGNEARSSSLAELSAMHHKLLTSSRVSDLLEASSQEAMSKEQERSLAEMKRQHQQALCIPAELVKAKSIAGSKCEHGWRQQRIDNDWPAFLANFEEVVTLSRQEARARQEASLQPHKTPYDALLDLYCNGDSSTLIDRVFRDLKQELPSLIAEIRDFQPTDPVSIPGPFPVKQQKNLSLKLMRCLGFNFDQGRLDESSHPFSTGDRGDHRITTRFRADEFLSALMATAHETGHASYEAGLPNQWQGLPIGSSRNMCIHESQSLLFEKHLFFSEPFLSFFLPIIHEHLAATNALSLDDIWTVSSHVQPSFIRVDADEVTYPLHIILRFEIESSLINEEMEAADVPDAWDEKMRAYLGLSTAGNYRDGCLQDIHWTDGSFGYFPSYTMGAVNSAQLFATIKNNYSDWDERLSSGDVLFIHEWLAENVWQKASSLDSQEIISQATGEETNPTWFLSHIRHRYLK